MIDIDIIAADLARDRSEVGQSRDDIHPGLRRNPPALPPYCPCGWWGQVHAAIERRSCTAKLFGWEVGA